MTAVTRPWPAGSSTGIGSMPGTDPDEAAAVVLGETVGLPYLPELPERGAGADMVGRAAALLAELHVDLQPSGWRVVARGGADERRADEMLRRDLDALEIATYGYTGALKVQVAGPLTLAASLQTESGSAMVSDHGARRDLAQALAAGVAEHVAEVQRRVPGAEVVLQVDEPMAPRVLGGTVPTASGLATLRAVPREECQALIAEVLQASSSVPVVHCCDSEPPLGMFRAAGAAALAVDVGAMPTRAWEQIAEAVEAGIGVVAGVLPTDPPDADLPSVAEAADTLRRPWTAVGLPVSELADVVVAPACGLAGWSPDGARGVLNRLREVAEAVTEDAAD